MEIIKSTTPAKVDMEASIKAGKSKQKKKGLLGFLIGMVILFTVVLFITQLFSELTYSSSISERFGEEMISEAFMALAAVMLVLITKNSYIMTWKTEKFSTSIKRAWPLIGVLAFFTLVSLSSILAYGFNPGAIWNTFIMSAFVGIYEEFLCRGWLLNTIRKHYIDHKNAEIIAVIASSVIFGLTHYINMATGQPFLDTTMQVLNATGLGLIFGFLFVTTRNIWPVVFIHGLWDFLIFLSETPKLSDTIYGETTPEIATYTNISTLILVIGLGLFVIYFYHNYKNTTFLNNQKLASVLPIVAIIVYISSFMIPVPEGYEENYIFVPDFETKNLGDIYETTRYGKNTFELNYIPLGNSYPEFNCLTLNCASPAIEMEPVRLEFKLDEKNIPVLSNINTGYSIKLSDDEDFTFAELVENDDNFFIAFAKGLENQFYYTSINKSDIGNSNGFIDKIKESIEIKYAPDIHTLGSIKVNDYNYAYTLSGTNKFFFVDKDGEVYIDQ